MRCPSRASPSPRPPLVAIVGPTAVGKTALSLELAARFRGEVVNADSRQVYRGIDIGTAKPSPEERARAPHHLLDLVGPDDEFSLACFLALARRAIAEIHRRGRLPLLVGGTGQYVWGLLEGWETPPVPPNPQLRRALEERARREGPEALYQELLARDPACAAFVDPRNTRRVIRALEVCLATGQPFSTLRRRSPPPFRYLALGLDLPREELDRRIEERVRAMLGAGWLEEVRRLLQRGYPLDLPSMSSLGYRELALHLQGRITLEEAVERITRQVRRLARRQRAWFRPTDPRIRWLRADSPDLVEQAASLVAQFLEATCAALC